MQHTAETCEGFRELSNIDPLKTVVVPNVLIYYAFDAKCNMKIK